MTFDELKKELQNPTQPLIDELSKRVDVAQGWCWGKHLEHQGAYWYCPCGKRFSKSSDAKSHIRVAPDITKPEVFWPLAWKNDITIVKVEQCKIWRHTLATTDIKGFIYKSNKPRIDVWINGHDNPGIAVGLACLEVMGNE